ncbi:MAG: TolC family protein, partial [Acidobacteria bacterium]|nr:TolC family protein [Acidobacteriota bacterium]
MLTLTPGWPAFAQTQQANRPADGLTLPLAVEIALQSNPLVRATSAGREIASAQTAEARAGRWPSVQISETLTAGNNPVFVFGSLLEQGRFRQSNFDLNALNNPSTLANSRFSISAKLPLFDQWQTATHVKQSQLREQQADAQGAQVQQQIRFEVLRAYYSILLAQAKKEVADEAVKLAEADVKRSRDRVEVGTSVVSDLLAAEVQLADFQQQQIQAEGEIITAQATLNTALGLPLSTPQTIAGQLVERNFDLAPTEELTQTALQQRPDLQRALLAKRTSEVQLKGARNEFLPRADVFTSVGASRNNFVSGSGDYLVGASVTFNLFDAGRNARIKQAQAADRLATSEQEHLANQIRLEVVRSYQQYIAARARLQVAERV